MSKFSFFASGFCAYGSLLNFTENDIGWGIVLGILSVFNILVGVINK